MFAYYVRNSSEVRSCINREDRTFRPICGCGSHQETSNIVFDWAAASPLNADMSTSLSTLDSDLREACHLNAQTRMHLTATVEGMRSGRPNDWDEGHSKHVIKLIQGICPLTRTMT